MNCQFFFVFIVFVKVFSNEFAVLYNVWFWIFLKSMTLMWTDDDDFFRIIRWFFWVWKCFRIWFLYAFFWKTVFVCLTDQDLVELAVDTFWKPACIIFTLWLSLVTDSSAFVVPDTETFVVPDTETFVGFMNSLSKKKTDLVLNANEISASAVIFLRKIFKCDEIFVCCSIFFVIIWIVSESRLNFFSFWFNFFQFSSLIFDEILKIKPNFAKKRSFSTCRFCALFNVFAVDCVCSIFDENKKINSNVSLDSNTDSVLDETAEFNKIVESESMSKGWLIDLYDSGLESLSYEIETTVGSDILIIMAFISSCFAIRFFIIRSVFSELNSRCFEAVDSFAKRFEIVVDASLIGSEFVVDNFWIDCFWVDKICFMLTTSRFISESEPNVIFWCYIFGIQNENDFLIYDYSNTENKRAISSEKSRSKIELQFPKKNQIENEVENEN